MAVGGKTSDMTIIINSSFLSPLHVNGVPRVMYNCFSGLTCPKMSLLSSTVTFENEFTTNRIYQEWTLRTMLTWQYERRNFKNNIIDWLYRSVAFDTLSKRKEVSSQVSVIHPFFRNNLLRSEADCHCLFTVVFLVRQIDSFLRFPSFESNVSSNKHSGVLFLVVQYVV